MLFVTLSELMSGWVSNSVSIGVRISLAPLFQFTNTHRQGSYHRCAPSQERSKVLT